MNSSDSYLTVSHRSRQRPHHAPGRAYLSTVLAVHLPPSASPPSPSPSSSSAAAAATPMSIPGSRETVPPPLPPPSHLPNLTSGHDLGWQWSNDPHSAHSAPQPSVKSGSSLLGQRVGLDPIPASSSPSSSISHHGNHSTLSQHDQAGAASVIHSILQDPGRDTTSMDDIHTSSNIISHRLHSERQLEQRSLEESSQTYDKHLLSRIGGPNTSRHATLAPTASALEGNANVAVNDFARQDLPQLKPLSLPDRRIGRAESPRSTRWASVSSGAVSPSFSTAGGGWTTEHGLLSSQSIDPNASSSSSSHLDTIQGPKSSHVTGPACSRSIVEHHGGGNAYEGIQHRASFDYPMFSHDDAMEEERPPISAHRSRRQHMLHTNGDQSDSRSGTKRRASSPPRDIYREDRSSVSSVSGQSDACQRRPVHYQPGQVSPNSRIHPNHSSISSMSSVGHRHGSLASSLGPLSMVSSATSLASAPLSPPSFTSAPRVLVEDRRMPPSSFVEGPAGPRQHSRSQIHGIFICECCPKKPKKFDSEDDLRVHESEKQYTCAYCPNRFKNKNEAERHQNSLHLRRHSWSCAALSTVEAAFHASSSGHEADTCGFCGEEFSNPPQWDVRAEHLNHVHKFGECNQSKKFFRADHFRQHLKHSHAGTSGKWTNMLENACMIEEPPPEKRIATGSSLLTAPGLPRSNMSVVMSAAHGVGAHVHGHHLQSIER